MSLIGKDW